MIRLSPVGRALSASLILTLAACAPSGDAADLVLMNGKIVTVDEALPEAEALAVRDGRIMAVGTDEEVEALVGPQTHIINLEGRLAIPGFIEGHGHWMRLGESQMILDLTETTSWDEVVALVREAAATAPQGSWIQGHGWHQEKWDVVPSGAVEGVPPHAALTAVSPNNPVMLAHASGHAAYANGPALQLAGITPDTPDPEGGTIVRDASGAATGLLRENADELVFDVMRTEMDQRSEDEKWADFGRQVELAGQEALSKGVTTFHDAGPDFETIDKLKRLADEGRLPVRLYLMVRNESNESMRERLADYRMIGYGDDFLTVRAIKRQIDGALGSHGAWLLDEYEDMATIGLTVELPEDIEETARIAAEAGFQLNTHAIGDRANRVVLDIYERAFEEFGDEGRRWRIEHAQHVHPDDIPRFAELGVIAAMQGVHATSDAPWVFRRLGAERAESGAYLWRTFLDLGVVVSNGTDVPVENISPVASFYSSVVRQDKDGNDFFPEQKMTRMEALESYTLSNAYAAFEEDIKGSLSVGKLADIAVLDRDIMTIPEDEIRGALVDWTIVGGRVSYERTGR